MKLFVQTLTAVSLTAISSIVQGQPIKNGHFFGAEPVTSSDEDKVFTGMTVTAVWADGTPDHVNGVGLYYLDKDGKESYFHHGVAKTKVESMILREGEYVDTLACAFDGSIITYVEFGTNLKNHTSAGSIPPIYKQETVPTEYQVGGFRSNQEQGKLTGLGALLVCQDHQKCA